MSAASGENIAFLFTNLESGARLWEQHPERMVVVQARHDAIISAASEANRGYIFQHLGDSVCVAFGAPDDALLAALAIQRGFQNEAWGEQPFKLKVALHSGPAELRDGEYFGPPTLNRMARILGVTNPGQILLSEAIYQQVGEQLPLGVSIRDLGERRLRDLPPEHIYQLVTADLPTAFPPLKTLDARPHNLPAQPTSFIGREHEQVEVADLLRQPEVRLLTLTGPGGTGKTRFSIQVAASLTDEYANGVWFVALASISDPQLVASTIAQTLGVKEKVGEALTDTLKEYLRERELLLVLDNFEQIVAAAPLLSELLATAPKLKALVSSRETLHLGIEHEYQVPPLALPDLAHLPPSAALAQYAAVGLFVQRAQAVKFDFALTAANAAAIAEICARLDGLPLAIELAAARVRMLEPNEMLARLSSRLALLTSGSRDRTARQQSLRGMIDWSYDLLDEGEKQLFVRLAVFVGGCTAEAAAQVCNATSELAIDVAEGLASLADKSLLRHIPIPAPGEYAPRFAMLETIREYALEKLSAGESSRFGMQKAIQEYARARLSESGEEEGLRHAHALYYTDFAEAAEPQVGGSQQAVWLALLEQEHDNLRAALTWALERGDGDKAQRLGAALWPFWEVHGHLSEGRRWLDEVLQVDRAETAGRARALDGAGVLAVAQGDYNQAQALFEQGLALARSTADQRSLISLLNHLAVLASNRGDEPTSIALHRECLTLAREVDDKRGMAVALTGLGRAAFYQGEPGKSEPLQREALALYREIGDLRSQARLQDNLGVVIYEQGDPRGAIESFVQSLNIYRTLGDRQNLAFTLNNLGGMTIEMGDLSQAQALLEEALAIRREMGDKLGVARTTNNLAQVAAAQGDYDKAYLLFSECIIASQQLGAKREIVSALERFAKIAAMRGQGARAAQLFGAAEAMREALNWPLPSSRQKEYEHDLAATTALLDEQTLAHAWAIGKAMSVTQAVEYALSGGEQ